jgi:hypothetical protein
MQRSGLAAVRYDWPKTLNVIRPMVDEEGLPRLDFILAPFTTTLKRLCD